MSSVVQNLPSSDQSEPPVSSSERKLPPNLQLGSDTLTGEIEVQIAQPEGKEGLFGSFLSRLSKAPIEDEVENKPDKRRDRRTIDKKADAGAKALQPLVSVGVAIAWTLAVGETLAPNNDEVDEEATPLSRLIARHIPIPDHLSDDFFDISAFAGAVSAHYMRIRPALKHLKEIREAEQSGTVSAEVADGDGRPRSALGQQVRGD